jgi:hypothetical protein
MKVNQDVEKVVRQQKVESVDPYAYMFRVELPDWRTTSIL